MADQETTYPGEGLPLEVRERETARFIARVREELTKLEAQPVTSQTAVFFAIAGGQTMGVGDDNRLEALLVRALARIGQMADEARKRLRSQD